MIKAIQVIKVGSAVLAALTLSACATRLGRDFDDRYAQNIKPGETTKAEVRTALGRPFYAKHVGEEDVWTYGFYRGGGIRSWFGTSPTPAQGAEQKGVVVTFKGDRVTNSKFIRDLPEPDELERDYR